MPINPCTGAPGATPHWTCIAANPPGHASPPGTHGTGGKRSLPAGRPVRPVYQSDQIRTREGYRGALAGLAKPFAFADAEAAGLGPRRRGRYRLGCVLEGYRRGPTRLHGCVTSPKSTGSGSVNSKMVGIRRMSAQADHVRLAHSTISRRAIWDATMTRFAITSFTALALFAAMASEGRAREKVARCRVESGGSVVVNGKCLFDADQEGSFHLGNVDKNKSLFDEILLINVVIVAQDVAEVRGLTRSGINSRWGEARRSSRDRACWDGADFHICAY